MSLNGLDDPTVIEAYQTALNEAGGWVLLHYVSRDEVALLDRGAGGVPEVRNAIDGYEEKSPLYGFLHYRRRKVVLSYLPEGISRLVQARTTVQFQSILDKFSPHDTVFSLSQPSELTESALSSACLLHTASGSITSSNSVRRRRLMEIAEDAEETPGAKDFPRPPTSTSKDFRQRSFSQLSGATTNAASIAPDAQPNPQGNEPSSIAKSPEESKPSHRPPSIAGDQHPEHSASRKDSRDELSRSESRRSTQSARVSLRDSERAHTYSPKVKLGPRPSVDGSGRPRTAGNLSRSAEQRPVASLPAGIRSSSLRKSTPSPARPRSQGSTVASMSGRTVPPVPPLLVSPLSMPISRPQLSPAAKSLNALSSSGMTQEKERLMKALQLRKTQMQKKAQGVKKPHEGAGERKPSMPDPIEDKENIDQGSDHVNHEETHAIKTNINEAGDGKDPLSEIQVTVIPEPNEECNGEKQASSDPVASEVVADTGKANLQTPLSDIGAEIPVETEETPEANNSQMTQAIPEFENNDVDGDLIKPLDGETKSGPELTSAVREVPLKDKSLTTPNEEIAALSPPEQKSLTPGEQEADAIGESITKADRSEPDPLPTSPSFDSHPISTPVPSTDFEEHVPEPQDDLTPDVSVAEQKEVDTRKEKRKPYLEPIQVPTPDYSDDDNLSDDSFMEELKSATLEEAKPISVGKSPLSPGYSNNGSENGSPDAWRNSRAVSNPSAIGHEPPSMETLAVGRSVSSPYTFADGPTGPVLVAKKINVSSGISKRIKALEKFTNAGDAPPTATRNLTAPAASVSFEALRKRASASLNTHTDATLGSRPVSFTPEGFSRASSVRRPVSQSGASVRRTSSVSVTPRIVRDSSLPPSEQKEDSKADPPESNTPPLEASVLIVDHDVDETPAEALTETLSEDVTSETVQCKSETRSMSTSSANSGSQSVATSIPRSESRMSISSATKKEEPQPKPASDAPASPEEKKESRTSRFLRRMSSITLSSRKNPFSSLSPVLKEESTPSDVGNEVAQAVDIGEVNVQFPDTLLWKRRFIRVDDKGYLVLTPGNVDSSNPNLVKRYHLSEFQTPALPDEDRQELPNSILLDFLDGSTLQCACESRQGQAFVLQTLVDAHSTQQHMS
ncbi:hypothetical protein BDV25DRAFT_157208 [Aspergillus avenaceus]|uniref:GPI-anchored cell surface glycoprotein n=1 Tax=Aspergillus avenaceus TaxID=36643 RepID=A0A5N6TRH1_ASPAV|nr:hypothetical protein BDV25DRAFT_157208 [Aspergillus avenaceus]